METQVAETPRYSTGNGVKLVAGLFFTVTGVLLTLDNLDILDAGRVLRWWPVVLIVIGVLNLREPGRRGLAMVSIAAGVLLIALKQMVIRVSLFDLWPLILIGAGVMIVVRALGIGGTGAPGGRNLWSVLSTRKAVVDPNELHGRSIITFMGGAEIELSGAGEDTTPVMVEVLSMWGGIEIRVPSGWEVIGEVVPIMGGVDIKADSTPGGRQLIVRGLVLMSGVEIKNARNS